MFSDIVFFCFFVNFAIDIYNRREQKMKAIISLDGILAFIHSLSLSASNKRWLGERLIEEARQEAAKEKQSYAEFIESMCGAWKDDPRTAEEISDEIRRTRQFGITRHIMPLTDEEK